MDYRIQRGDTLTALAKRFGTTVEKLARAYAHVYDHYFGAGSSAYGATGASSA